MNLYLDNAATTPVDPIVTQTMFDWQNRHFGNPSSPHKHGQAAKIKLEEIRDQIAGELNSRPKEIVFTSGGTESNNKAIIGAALANQHKGKHIICSGVEHPSVMDSGKYLENLGFERTIINLSPKGSLSIDALIQSIRPDTILVSMMYVNNETGIILPITEIADVCRQKGILFHCDAVQAFGKFKIDSGMFNVDLLSFSAHKIHGPKGIGGLYIRDGVALNELVFGGGQEANRRAGTENITGIVGLGKALDLMQDKEINTTKVNRLQNRFEELVNKKISDAYINGHETDRSPFISNISFPGVDNQSLLLKLDFNGLSASVGSACSSGSIKQSHVLQAMHLSDEIISSSARFSFSRFNTEKDIIQGVEILAKIVNELRPN